MAAMSDSDFEPITPGQRPSKSFKTQLTQVLANMKHTKSDFMQKMLAQNSPDSVKLLLKSKASGAAVLAPKSPKAIDVRNKPVFKAKNKFDDEISTSCNSSGSEDEQGDESDTTSQRKQIEPKKNTPVVKTNSSSSSDDSSDEETMVKTQHKQPLNDQQGDESDSTLQKKQIEPKKNTQVAKENSSSSSDDSSDEETMVKTQHKPLLNVSSHPMKPAIQLKTEMNESSSESDSGSSTDDEETVIKPTQVVKQTVRQEESGSSESESSGSSSEDEKTVVAPSMIVNQKQTPLKAGDNNVSSGSSEDDGSSSEEETTAINPSVVKASRVSSSSSSESSSDEEDTLTNPPHKQTVTKSSKQNSSSSGSEKSSSDEELSTTKPPETLQPQNKSNQNIHTRSSLSGSDDSSSDDNKAQIKVEKQTPTKVIPTNNSSSSSDDSSSSEDERTVKPIQNQIPIKKSPLPNKKTVTTPINKINKRENVSDSDSDNENVSANRSRRSSSNSKSGSPDRVNLTANTKSAQSSTSRNLIDNYAKKCKLEYVKPDEMLDVYKDIGSDDEVFLMKISKNLQPNLLIDTNFSLTKPKLITVGDDTFKLTVDNKEKNDVCLVGQSNGDYAMRKLQTVGSITINKEHRVQKLEPIVRTSHTSVVPFPTEQLRDRHPLFGTNYKSKITLDPEISQKLDCLINTLEKKHKKKLKKSTSVVEETPPKKSRKRKLSVSIPTVDDTDSGINVQGEPIVKKKKSKRKSLGVNIESALSELFPSPVNVLNQDVKTENVNKSVKRKKDKNKSTEHVAVINIKKEDISIIQHDNSLNLNKSGDKKKKNKTDTVKKEDSIEQSHSTLNLNKSKDKKKKNKNIQPISVANDTFNIKKEDNIELSNISLNLNKTKDKKKNKNKSINDQKVVVKIEKTDEVNISAAVSNKSQKHDTPKKHNKDQTDFETIVENLDNHLNDLQKESKKNTNKTREDINDILSNLREENRDVVEGNNNDTVKKSKKKNKNKTNTDISDMLAELKEESVLNNNDSIKKCKKKNKNKTYEHDSSKPKEANTEEMVIDTLKKSKKKDKKKTRDNEASSSKDDTLEMNKSKVKILEEITFPVTPKKHKTPDVPQLNKSKDSSKKILPQLKQLSSVANSTMMSPSINKTLYEPDESQILPDKSVQHKKRRKSESMHTDFLEKLMETVQQSESPAKKKKKKHSKTDVS